MTSNVPKKTFNVLEELKYSSKEQEYSSSGLPLKVSRGSRTGKHMFDDEISTRDKNGSILSNKRNNGRNMEYYNQKLSIQ